ncbi:hypothetical protein B0H14DRAFT_3859201 [Mycena olivaceomarginata]|nr:hypothetical protein B0H14DRAFT_3859201 [Mycena olivaceomarginata]
MFFSRALLVFASAALLIPSALGVPASPAADDVDISARASTADAIVRGKGVLTKMAAFTLKSARKDIILGGILSPTGGLSSGAGLLGCLGGNSGLLGGLLGGSLLKEYLSDPASCLANLLNGGLVNQLLNGLLGPHSLLGGLCGNLLTTIPV